MKYSPEIAAEIVRLTKSAYNYNVHQICKRCNIAVSTYFLWRKEKIEFSEALKKAALQRGLKLGKMAVISLKRSLKKTKLKEVRKNYIINENGEEVLAGKQVIIKEQPPSTVAAIFLAKAHYPEIYGDKNKDDGENTNNEIVIV